MVGRLALSSHHPLAAAVARGASDRTPIEGAVEAHGQGVRAMIDGHEARLGSTAFCGLPDASWQLPAGDSSTSLIAFTHGDRKTVLAIRQSLRPDAITAVKALKAQGYDVRIMSGDRTEAVAPIAAALGVSSWQAALKPAGNIAALDALKAAGRRVLMVGDGLNDAPALAAAHASLSPISAIDLAQAQADAVFLGERLQPVVDALAIARRARRLMLQNLGTCYDLQRRCDADCDRRSRHAANRSGGDVRLLALGCPECAAGTIAYASGSRPRRGAIASVDGERGKGMNVLIYLLPMALALGLTGLAAFLWSLKSGQYDDVEGAALRVLADDDIK